MRTMKLNWMNRNAIGQHWTEQNSERSDLPLQTFSDSPSNRVNRQNP